MLCSSPIAEYNSAVQKGSPQGRSKSCCSMDRRTVFGRMLCSSPVAEYNSAVHKGSPQGQFKSRCFMDRRTVFGKLLCSSPAAKHTSAILFSILLGARLPYQNFILVGIDPYLKLGYFPVLRWCCGIGKQRIFCSETEARLRTVALGWTYCWGENHVTTWTSHLGT